MMAGWLSMSFRIGNESVIGIVKSWFKRPKSKTFYAHKRKDSACKETLIPMPSRAYVWCPAELRSRHTKTNLVGRGWKCDFGHARNAVKRCGLWRSSRIFWIKGIYTMKQVWFLPDLQGPRYTWQSMSFQKNHGNVVQKHVPLETNEKLIGQVGVLRIGFQACSKRGKQVAGQSWVYKGLDPTLGWFRFGLFLSFLQVQTHQNQHLRRVYR